MRPDGNPAWCQMEVLGVEDGRVIAGMRLYEDEENTFLDVSKELIKEELAVPAKSKAASQLTFRVNSYVILRDLQERHQLSLTDVENLDKETAKRYYIPVVVTYVEDPTSFFIRLALPHLLAHYNGMEEYLNFTMEFYAKHTRHEDELNHVKIENRRSCVFAEASEFLEGDRIWRRGRVMEILNPEDGIITPDTLKFKVLAVDTGCVHTITRRELWDLPEKFTRAYPYAIKCQVNGIAPPPSSGDKWSRTAIENVREMSKFYEREGTYILLKETLEKKKKEPILVELFFKDNEVPDPFAPNVITYNTVYEKLAHQGLAIKKV